jgi:hypothetical protein
MSCPYTSSDLNETLSWPKIFTLINPELIVNMIGFLLLLLEYALSSLDIFIFEGMVLCNM